MKATLAYAALALVLTWPLALGLGRDVPADLGDPLLNMWILSWGAEQISAILGGDAARASRFFDANIFHPAPLTLAYSEHLFPQALQGLPLYWATGNPILVYNLLFLATFALSGLGTFLLVRDLTGSAGAAFLAGLLFAFAPYRWSQASHLQVLSAQWMPFVLYGLHRYFESGRRWPLAGATAALVLQNLSCGYYMLYFAPLTAVYVLWELAKGGRWRRSRVWVDAGGALAIAGLLTLPFLLPYKQVRDSLQMTRDPTEVVRYSADVYSYFTASQMNRTWHDVVRAYPKAEGELFPGAVPLLLAAAGLAAWGATSARTAPSGAARAPRWVLALILVTGLAYALLAAAAIFLRRLDLDLTLFSIRATNVTRLLAPPLFATAALLVLSPTVRARMRSAARQPEAVFAATLVLAWWLSLGPSPRVLGRVLEIWSPYRVLYELAPGYEGVRVPARFAMIVALALSVLGGLAAARLPAGRPRAVGIALLAAAFLAETHVLPFPLNAVSPLRGFATPEARVFRPERAPAVYQELGRVAADAVVLELPLGEPDYDVRAVYYSTAHWRRLVNGYSGFFPPHYSALAAVLSTAGRGDDLAWETLLRFGVTHVVVHEGAYLDDEGVLFGEWLRRHGAAEVFRDGKDVLFVLGSRP